MRVPFLSLVLLALAPVAAAEDGRDPRAAFVERRGLLEADVACRLFTPSVRDALLVGSTQARGALLRAGWSSSQVQELERAAISAARARACTDERTISDADAARRGFAAWANAGTMEFPGWDRAWTARRTNRADGWRISQSIDAPLAATFGVRDRNAAQHLSLTIPLTRTMQPASATLVLRDPASARATEVSLNQRIALGLAAGAPSAMQAKTYAGTRAVERPWGGQAQTVFVFPDAAFRDLLQLDPRESVEIRVQNGRTNHRLLIEVGDIAAARAFLVIRR